MATMDSNFDHARAFGGIDRLYGDGARVRLMAAHCVVIGVGGVGSWAAEALARSGVGQLTLIDADHIAESNLNRQLPALCSTLGMAKVEALRLRVADINPTCAVNCVDTFATEDNLAQCIPAAVDGVVDAIDAPRVKAALIAYARAQRFAHVVCGAAGGKVDATAMRIVDVSAATHDPLLARVRSALRRRYDFAKNGVLNVPCVSSAEPRVGARPEANNGGALACAGYGSVVTVTATMGFIAAGWLVRRIAGPC